VITNAAEEERLPLALQMIAMPSSHAHELALELALELLQTSEDLILVGWHLGLPGNDR
jgi:hypothetical protein